MKFGKIIGNVISSQNTGCVQGLRLLLVNELDEKLNPLKKAYVCTDTVNAKHGDIVLTCSSSSARSTKLTKNVCTDNTIIAIVDIISLNKETFYRKETADI